MNRRAASLALGVGTALFGMAMASREIINPWWTISVAATVTLVLAGVALRGRAKSLLHITHRNLLVAAGVGVILVVTTHVGYQLAATFFPGLSTRVGDLYQEIRRDMPSVVVTVPLLLIVVAAEELLWRGVAVEYLRQHVSGRRCIWSAAALYAVPQVIGGSFPLVLAAMLLGLWLAYQRMQSQSLWGPMITHSIWSTAVFVVFPLA